jgi:hypothetical protein
MNPDSPPRMKMGCIFRTVATMPEKPGFCSQSNVFSLNRLLEKHDILAWKGKTRFFA